MHQRISYDPQATTPENSRASILVDSTSWCGDDRSRGGVISHCRNFLNLHVVRPHPSNVVEILQHKGDHSSAVQ